MVWLKDVIFNGVTYSYFRYVDGTFKVICEPAKVFTSYSAS